MNLIDTYGSSNNKRWKIGEMSDEYIDRIGEFTEQALQDRK
ncbi:MAG: hypothetical protein ABEJ95_04585 [Candidatus Nanohalobium sp.]